MLLHSAAGSLGILNFVEVYGTGGLLLFRGLKAEGFWDFLDFYGVRVWGFRGVWGLGFMGI